MAVDNAYAWGNLGNIEHELYRFEEAEFCFKKGLSVATTDAQRGFLCLTYAAMLVQSGDWERAVPMCKLAFEYKDKAKTRANLGLAYLATGNWKEGWPLYDAIIGFDKSRRKMQYANEQEWDGSKDKTVVIYDEQGIGDAISFASMVPDAMKDATVVIDIRPELAGLFKRSFPQATVYGSAMGAGEDWRPKHQIDASISLGGLGKLYRPSAESFPGTAYLKADPDRVTMWKALFAKETKPVIGIAWSGGMEHTGAKHRIWKLEELLPIFRSVDAVWVSLQYKDAGREIAEFTERFPDIDLRQYRYGTLTPDYDDTAALVECVDMVVTMQTACGHLAGALGKECWIFVNKHSQWRYGPNTQKTIPWYSSVQLFRNVDGWPFDEAAKALKAKYEHC